MVDVGRYSKNSYRQRKPYESPLYKILQDCFEEYVNSYETRFQKRYGAFRESIRKTVKTFLDCGLYENGFARCRCPGCAYEQMVPYSCKSRLCPSCTQKRVLLWAERCVSQVLQPVPHRSFTWTIPKLLRAYFRYDRSLLGKLARCSFLALRDYYRKVLDEDDIVPGSITVGQSSGNSVNDHAHVHSLATEGAYRSDGTFLPVERIDTRYLCELFMFHTFTMLLREGRITHTFIELILSWKHSGFNVDASTRFHGGDRATAERLARYISKPAIALERLAYDPEAGIVSYRTKNGVISMEPADFIGRLMPHIPDTYENGPRYYGAYSNRFRSRMWANCVWNDPRTATTEVETGDKPPPTEEKESRKPASSWIRLLRKVWNADALKCPLCNTRMKIIAVIPPSQQDVIERIIDHCNLRAPTRGPPPRSTMPDIHIDPVISIGCENSGFFPDPIYDA